MISFNSVRELQHALPEVQAQAQHEGKLQIAGREYQISPATQQITRSNPATSNSERFFENIGKLFREGSTQSVAKELTQTFFGSESAQAQRLQSSSSVEHARMLFKDAGIDTPTDVLNSLSKADSKLIENNSAELNQLAAHAMKESLLDTSSGQKLSSLIGDNAAKALGSKIVEAYGGGFAAVNNNPTASVNTMQMIVDMEIDHLGSAQTHIEALSSTDLSQGVYAETLAESTFNPNGLTDDVDRATAWILKASTSKGNEQENFAALLREYVANDKDLLDFNTLKELHSQLVPDIERDYRGPNINGGTLPSSIGGEGMLKQHLEGFLQDKSVSNKDLGKQLFSSVIGYHGFTDGNGRMGRTLFAIAELRNSSFNPLSITAENALHGIK